MKKILHLITGVEKGGGAEKMLLSTLPFLRSAEHAVCALKGRGEIGRALEEAGIKVFYLEMKGFLDLGIIGRYRRVLADFKPDIQINYLIHADVFGRIFAKRFGVKKLISYIRNRHTKIIFRILDFLTLPAVDYLLANSRAVLDFYRQSYRFPKERSACIPNGIDLTPVLIAEEEKENIKTEFSLYENDLILVLAARLHKQKDLPTLLRAIAKIKDQGVFCPKLLLCGQGREKENLENLAEALGISDNVKFLGMRNNVSSILAMADIFILPSLHEGMSNALLEAMAAGKSCIVSDIPENTELIKNKENGLVFHAGNPGDLADKITALASSPVLATALGKKAREDITAYDIKKIIEKLDEFFIERLQEKKKIVWVANDLFAVHSNFFNALGENFSELDLLLIAGDIQKSEGRDKFFRWRIFKFSYRVLFNLFFLPRRILAGIKKKKIDSIKLDFYRGLGKLLKKENPDLVMANLYLQPTSWQALWYCFIHRKPLFLWEEKKNFGLTRWRRLFSFIELALAVPLLLFVKKIYCPTSAGVEFGKRYFPVWNKKKIELLPASTDTRIFYNEHRDKDDGVLRILVVARMVPFKRYEDILRALKSIKDRNLFKFVLNIRGDGPLEDDINKMIDRFGMRDHVNFIPPTPYEKQRETYNQNDIFILASYNEPIGAVVMEAMACGLPVIISDTCGVKTCIRNGENGYIFKTFDYFDLAEKIILLSDKKNRERLGAAAEKTIKEEFDSRLVARDFFAKIKNLF